MQDITYNGWRNRNTWLLALWLENDGMIDYFLDCIDRRDGKKESMEKLANSIEDWFNNWLDDQNINPMLSDFLDTSGIDYLEIAENWLSDFEWESE